MSLFVLVVDDEADIEMLFRQHFRKELRGGDFEPAPAEARRAIGREFGIDEQLAVDLEFLSEGLGEERVAIADDEY